MALGRPGLRRTLSGYAALVRVPNLFTAPPDVLAGIALATAVGTSVLVTEALGAAVASVLLYAGGTTLNDYFDAEVDAEERPERPIPSGRVSRTTALALGTALLVSGVAVAFVAAGLSAGFVAALVALVVVLYDGPLKGGPAGFLAMGTARGLNVTLGFASTSAIDLYAAPSVTVPPWLFVVPPTVTLYVAAFTYMAAREATGADRRAVVVAAMGAAMVTPVPPVVVLSVDTELILVGVSTLLAGAFITWTGRALQRAYRNPSPEVVGPAIGTCVLALIVLDAAFAAGEGLGWALGTLSFLIPAAGLTRAFDIS
ncbi:4-hydroxybenzoate polyprenyltransferase [Halopelagius longus]|uniref:4-hydroxybenzoate polyprenyltransferase n=1 Tax=Halopelagius longus TaxID=1236180 RepID=A0A1H1GS56_9EURY|nr:4-hydroxybenzoate polyprenyltransferase [Halopelagius longus]SDR16015.1 4-hydroxybenzoate polyprenyltransferase [Halopelagius longus]